jgi:bla regulator protein blaR1
MAPAITHATWSFLAALGNAAVRSLVLAGFVAAALGAFRVKNVRIRLFAWKGLVAASLAMPVLMLLAPAIPIAVPVLHLSGHGAKAAAIETAPAPALEAANVAQTVAKSPPHMVTSAHADRVQGGVVAAQPAAPLLPVPRRKIPWLFLILGSYMAIALALLARIFVGMRFGNRLVRSATPVSHVGALQLLSATSRAAGLRDAPELRESDALCVPLMLGVRGPAILLPSDWRMWDDGELAAVLSHEVSHVERNDALAQRLALIHRAVFWFSPLSWWLERHLDELAEQASDEAALAAGADRTRYAETLLGFFAELEAGPERVWWQGVSMAKAGQAEKRVDRILAWRGAMSNRLRKSLVVSFVMMAAPVVALTAAARPAADDIQPPPVPAAPQAPPATVAPSPAPSPDANANPAPAAPPAPAPDSDSFQLIVPPVRVFVPPIPPLPPMHATVPQIRITGPLVSPDDPSQDVAPEPPIVFSMSGDWDYARASRGGYFVGRYYGWGSRFAIVTKDSDELIMAGDRADAEHARALKKKIPGDFIWFERDDKPYIISDQETVERAKKLWQPDEELAKQRKDLGKLREDLGKQQEDTEKKVEEMKIKVPDLTAEMQKVEEAMKKLSAEGATLDELADLQGQIGELQSRIGQAESSAGLARGAWGREQGEWGRKIGEIARKEAEFARKQVELSREATRQMRQLLDDAIAHGLAKPE